jgi:putative endonuclease
MSWQVYIILCSDDSLYTGITTDIGRRFSQHHEGRGAKYFRARRPLEVVYLEKGHTRSTACKREIQVKKMMKTEKCRLISSEMNEVERCCEYFENIPAKKQT